MRAHIAVATFAFFTLGSLATVGCRDDSSVASLQDVDPMTITPDTPAAPLLQVDAEHPELRIFTIPADQGKRPWNTKETSFDLVVGQTLRIINQDASAKHTLHTPGKPCPHGGTAVYDSAGTKLADGLNTLAIPVGGWIDCVLKDPITNEDNRIYDHYQFNNEDDNGNIFINVVMPEVTGTSTDGTP